MNIHRKALPYEQAKARLNSFFARTGKIPSIRELKAECGGAGSNETYQQYLKRWLTEQSQASGTMPGLVALRNQVQANAEIMFAIIDQLMRQNARLALLEDGQDGACDGDLDNTECDDGDPDFDGEDIGGASQARLTPQPIARGDEPAATVPESAPTADGPGVFAAAAQPAAARTRPADQLIALVENFGLHAEARFLPPNEDDDAPRAANTFGERESRSAPVPTDQGSPENTNTSLSRSNGGSQQAAFPFDPTKPETGESDTNGGSANGTA